MAFRSRSLEARRAESWALGVELRERLLREFVAENRLRERPFLKDVIDDLIRDIQGARLRPEALPLDRFAQTEVVDGRIEVSINTRIGEIPGVKDAAGVAHVAKLHECVHVDRDLRAGAGDRSSQLTLLGFEAEPPRLIVCRGVRPIQGSDARRESIAENAALAAAIAGPDLARCGPFLQFQRLAADGGSLGGEGWRLLYRTAEDIGVNITALVRYFQQRGFIRIEEERGRRDLIAAPSLFGEVRWL